MLSKISIYIGHKRYSNAIVTFYILSLINRLKGEYLTYKFNKVSLFEIVFKSMIF